jgi:1,4-alpha-glucan branching enzyme
MDEPSCTGGTARLSGTELKAQAIYEMHTGTFTPERTIAVAFDGIL